MIQKIVTNALERLDARIGRSFDAPAYMDITAYVKFQTKRRNKIRDWYLMRLLRRCAA